MSLDDCAIVASGLGKRYEVLVGARGPGRLSEAIGGVWQRRRRASREDFWALRDVSFELRRGEVLGIVGRNGAGKSTLLKLLTRVTQPTEGTAQIRGRVGSLLEVGAGFHPELSGGENVYLYGAILGMGRSEIRSRFEEIVQFAGVERFVDTPVKRYSSGMYMRLAFAVAAHLDSEILLVDEVLAVGDDEFQRRSLGKMGEVAAAEGRSVIFVSHNMNAVTRLCDRGIWLEDGTVRNVGEAAEVVEAYLGAADAEGAAVELPEVGHKDAQIARVAILDTSGLPRSEIEVSEDVIVELEIVVRSDVRGLYAAFYVRNREGICVLFCDSRESPSTVALGEGRHRLRVAIPPRLLAAGNYSITAGLASPYEGQVDHREGVLRFALRDQSSLRGGSRPSVVGMILPWERVGGS